MYIYNEQGRWPQLSIQSGPPSSVYMYIYIYLYISNNKPQYIYSWQEDKDTFSNIKKHSENMNT